MHIVRRSLFESACKLEEETIYDPENQEHASLLSSGLALINELPLHLRNGANGRKLIVLTPKGEEVVRLDHE